MNWRGVEENNACEGACGGRNSAGELVTKDMEKAEVFNASFASFFTDKTGLEESWASQSKRKIWNRKYSPTVEEVQVWTLEQTGHNQVHGCWWGTEGQLLGELANVKVLSTIFKRLWWSKLPMEKGKCHCNPQEGQKGSLVSLTWVPGQVMEQIHQETISKRHEDKEVTGSSQQGFMKGKSCLT